MIDADVLSNKYPTPNAGTDGPALQPLVDPSLGLCPSPLVSLKPAPEPLFLSGHGPFATSPSAVWSRVYAAGPARARSRGCEFCFNLHQTYPRGRGSSRL